MDWNTIPSLAALRAFDALARYGSLSAAGRQLNVTHAAVAQHLRGLEDHFGERLAERDGQAMRLTATGRELAVALGEGFDIIAEGIGRIARRHENEPINVALTPTFAEAWLVPRIGAFWKAHPEVELRLMPSTRLADLRRDQIDVAIRFGDGNWPKLDVSPLALQRFVVTGAPGHVGLPDDLTRCKWLYSFGAKEQWIWAREIGIDYAEVDSQEMPNNSMVLSAVRAGVGISVQSRAIVAADLASGQLVCLREGDPGGLGYYLVTRHGVVSPGARTFIRWLKREADQAQT
jgi:LysR family glycine cleavage system transcriptional activator